LRATIFLLRSVWLYVRFTLSYRDVEDLLAERGLDVSYETMRRWVLKFGPLFARELRGRPLLRRAPMIAPHESADQGVGRLQQTHHHANRIPEETAVARLMHERLGDLHSQRILARIRPAAAALP
jgi:hypothetical protein